VKVVYRLTGLLLLGACLVLTIYGLQTVRREALMFETTMIEDARLIGRTLRAALREVSRVEGPKGVRRLVADASQHDDKLEFRWAEGEELSHLLSPAERAQLESGEEVVQVQRRPNELRLYLPLALAGSPAGALEVRESLEREDTYVRKSLIRIGFATALLILISGGSAFLIGVRVVGRPIERLIEKARRVGQGDLSGPVLLSQQDEIGQLAAAMNEMCEQLRVETEQRREAEDQLRHAERLATVGKLSSGLAHELGTPLNVVLGRGLQIAEDERCPADLAEAAQVVVHQSERMSGIIRQLLDFARRGPPRVEPIDLPALAEEVALLLEGMARRQNVQIELDLQPCAGLRGDSEQLRQALTNLTVNGIEAMERGGTLKLSLREREAAPRDSARLRRCCAISIEDEGPGVEAELRERVFEPFFTTKDVGKGTGLGLAVTHGIVSDHRGWITVESEPGSGARFTIYLPQEEAA